MDDITYQKLVDQAFRAIGDALEDVDSDAIDCETAGDVLTLTLRGARSCVVNTQRPTRQIWLAAASCGWHFAWDPVTARWVDGRGDELLSTLARVVREGSGVDVAFR